MLRNFGDRCELGKGLHGIYYSQLRKGLRIYNESADTNFNDFLACLCKSPTLASLTLSRVFLEFYCVITHFLIYAFQTNFPAANS